MRSRFEHTRSLLDMAESLCKGIQQPLVEESMSPSTLRYELELAKCVYHHHRGGLGLHTNDPNAARVNLEPCAMKLQMLLDEEARRSNSLLGVVFNELGNAYLQLGKTLTAIETFNRSVTMLQSLRFTTKNLVTMPQINLAFAYWVDGRLDDASSLFKQALNDRFEELGVKDTSSFT